MNNCDCNDMKQEEMLCKIKEYQFSIIELGLYLDTHPEDEKAFLKNFAPFISNNNIDLITELFEESINQIERNGNASLIFLDNSFKIFNYFKMK